MIVIILEEKMGSWFYRWSVRGRLRRAATSCGYSDLLHHHQDPPSRQSWCLSVEGGAS